MATKTYKLRIDFAQLSTETPEDTSFRTRAEEVRQHLWDTHVAFNAGVNYLAKKLIEMHRGAGVWREFKEGIWRDWQPIRTEAEVNELRARKAANPDDIAIAENTAFVRALNDKTQDLASAMQMAFVCSQLVERLCPPSEGKTLSQMDRGALYLLFNPHSSDSGVRPSSADLKWELWNKSSDATSYEQLQAQLLTEPAFLAPKGMKGGHPRLRDNVRRILNEFRSVEGDGDWQSQRERFFDTLPRPKWLRDRAILEECKAAKSLNDLANRLRSRPEFTRSDRKVTDDGRKLIDRIEKLKKDAAVPWETQRDRIVATAQAETREFRLLLENGCLPVPDFGLYVDEENVTLGPVHLSNCNSEWKLAMWNMAGQKVRSHFGWVRRRARERLLWRKKKRLFEQGGWIRTKRDGKKIWPDDIAPEDITFTEPAESPDDFEHRGAFAERRWFKTLGLYERDEMPKHLERVAFAAAGTPKLTVRTTKGWPKIRNKWSDRLKKNAQATTRELLEVLNSLRNRTPRDFGDQRVFEWLAQPDRRWLWNVEDEGEDNDCGRDDRDCVSAFTKYNEDFAVRPESITFTENHATKHPVWAFFGENSAVEYSVERRRETVRKDGKEKNVVRLYVVFSQLLKRNPHGPGYTAVKNVRVPLRGYVDFEQSFPDLCIPDDAELTPKQEIRFADDLLAGETLRASLSGIKVTWDRSCLPKKADDPPTSPPTDRVYVSFSCEVHPRQSPDWILKGGEKPSDVASLSADARDGVANLLYLRRSITRESEREASRLLPPGQRRWPKAAIEQRLAVCGNDQGARRAITSVAWVLTKEKPSDGDVAWKVGECDGNAVYSVLMHERNGLVSLPGDDEALPGDEQLLRERLVKLRTRLNLQKAILGIARLLSAVEIERREFTAPKHRYRRKAGIRAPTGRKVKELSQGLSDDDIRANCDNAAQQLLRWASSDAMAESLAAIGHDGDLWSWLGAKDKSLVALVGILPTTQVPTEREAKAENLDRNALKAAREQQDAAFNEGVYSLRAPLSMGLAADYDPKRQRRATHGLWAELDRALLLEVSYSVAPQEQKHREQLPNGLLRALRKRPVTKHGDITDVNHLPLGKTFRGGLSMRRLEFLDQVKDFVRKWSCRARWPGDVRRVPEGQDFDVADNRHLDHLREHRVKLVAHAAVAAALGFEQDLRRGLWRYDKHLWHHPETGRFFVRRGDDYQQVPTPVGADKSAASGPHRVDAACHIQVFEDLGRYTFQQDRPKTENSRLREWSHRRILKFAQHIGGLFGLPLAIVKADYSSRFCSRCGAPGFRASRFDPAWLSQRWVLRRLESTDPRDNGLKSIARQISERLEGHPGAFERPEDRLWALLEGGTHFVCANRNCVAHTVPLDADENAAANIGLWFLRGRDDFRVRLSAAGTISGTLNFLATSSFQRSHDPDQCGDEFWLPITADARRRQKRAATLDEDDRDEQETAREGSAITLFRDPSCLALDANRWYEARIFWGKKVPRMAAAGVRAANADMFAPVED